MFKFLVIVLLCIIALHACADTALYAVHLPFDHNYIALVNGTDVTTFNTPFQLTDYRDWETDRKSTRLNSSHSAKSRMPSSA